MLFQTCMIFVHLRSTNVDIIKKKPERSDASLKVPSPSKKFRVHYEIINVTQKN